MKRLLPSILLVLAAALSTKAQLSITATGTAFTQNFDGIGSSATAALPPGFKIGPDWATGTTATTVAAGTSGTGAITGTSSGGTYNFANGVTASSTDRAVGFLTSGSFTSPKSIVLRITNNTGSTISSFSISFDYEKYRSGSRALDWTFFHGSSPAPATAATAGDQNYPADPNNNVISNPPLTSAKTVTISGLSIANGSDYYLRWTFTGLAGSSNSQGVGIDNFSVTATGGGPDVTPPAASSFVPADNAINASTTAPLQINFSESVIKGAGNILIKNLMDNSIVQTIDVSSAAVNVTGATAVVTISSLANSTGYFVEIPAGAFTDASLNPFAGITGNSTWNFTTQAAPAAGIIGFNYSFTDCNTFIPDGWSTYSVTGAQVWECLNFGRTADNGMQINGFATSAQLNEDWLISPKYDLTAATLPTLKFYSRGKFAGNSLELRISTNYVTGSNPNTAIWTTLNGAFPPTNSDVWTLSDNIDLSSYNTANVSLAWFYTSTTTAASRWTVDDISIYTGVVLAPCDEPADPATALVLNATPTSVSGSFTASASTVDGYIVVRSLSSTLSAPPVDGTNYTAGQALGGGTVIANGTTTTFTDAGLSPSTAYYYFVFAYNSENCSGGTNYLTTVTPAPAGNTGTISTLAFAPCVQPVAAASALVLSATNTTISGTFTAEASANRYLVIISQNASLSAAPADGTSYIAGSPFGGGTVVSYSNNNSFTATGLTAATQYYFYIYSVSGECTGEPDYFTGSILQGSKLTTSGTGVPAGYYDNALGSCQPLKTALRDISANGYNTLSYTPGVWLTYQYSDLHRNDANTADIIWDIYSDNPTGPEPYTYTYQTNQCGNYTAEGQCYNREHSTPKSWFAEAAPMYTDVHHLYPTDGKVNAVRSNFPYGEVTSATDLSLNGSKLGTGNNFGYTGTVFEPINAYKGDVARTSLYMATRYENEIIANNWSANGTANALFLSPTDEPDAVKRKLQIYDTWYLKTVFKWMTNDPVSQKEIDRNNAIYYQSGQNNRNPFVDHPEYAALIFQCTGVLPVTIVDFTAQKNRETVLLRWYATLETSFKNYDVERSTDGVTFNRIGEVTGENLSNYSFTDINLPKASVVYYRLKMIDLDGKSQFSKIVSVRLNNNTSNAIVYPNPTKDFLNIRLDEALQGNSLLSVYDVAGRLVKMQSANAGTVNIQLSVNELSAGRYFVKIVNGRQVINESFVVIK